MYFVPLGEGDWFLLLSVRGDVSLLLLVPLPLPTSNVSIGDPCLMPEEDFLLVGTHLERYDVRHALERTTLADKETQKREACAY